MGISLNYNQNNQIDLEHQLNELNLLYNHIDQSLNPDISLLSKYFSIQKYVLGYFGYKKPTPFSGCKISKVCPDYWTIASRTTSSGQILCNLLHGPSKTQLNTSYHIWDKQVFRSNAYTMIGVSDGSIGQYEDLFIVVKNDMELRQ